LDDISGSGVVTSATSVSWSSGSRVAGTSYTALSGASALLNSGWNRFTLPLFGGFDGFDVTESEPFRNSGLTSATETTNYAFYSLSKAIGIAADPMVNMNVVTIPGVTNTGIKNQLIQLCEERGDAIAILDPVGGFTPRAEGTAVSYGSVTNVDTVVTNTKEQAYNTSYAAMYYPWVKSVDGRTGQQVWLPPSIPALGVFSNTDRRADPWFAPAGFTRGGLSSGAGGVSVVGVAQELTAKERDKLYEININPIAQFPAEGIVVYGQKTLQFSRSALDRINVRRLMLYVKKEVSRIAATTLFNPNTLVTWNDFKSRVTILLDSVKSRYGLEEFKVVLDETTTTPDLVDQNIMYAKILLKPTKTTEFIAVDFVITNSGASFED
jgi:phage tail sheath protein FI